MSCRLLHPAWMALLAFLWCPSLVVTEMSSSLNEVGWVDKIAVEHFGMSEVDGKVEGVEVRLFNGKRVDLIWKNYAIEADWANKAPEGIGQCLYYAAVTHREPGLLLLVKDASKEVRYVEQALVVCRRNKPEIRLWAYDTTNKRFLRVSDNP